MSVDDISPKLIIGNVFGIDFRKDRGVVSQTLLGRVELIREALIAAFEVTDVLLTLTVETVEIEHVGEL